VEVKVTPAGLDVRASAAPLSEVLDRISRQTGMKVVYEGAPARTPVTAALERPTAAEVVMSLLEGQGMTYALVMDPTGTRVETLMMLGSASGGLSGTATPTPRNDLRRNLPRRPEPAPEEPQAPEPEEEQEQPQQEAPPGARPGQEQPPPVGAPVPQPTPYPVWPFTTQPAVPVGAPAVPGAGTPGVPVPPQPEAAPAPSPTPPPTEPR
jgi:hypothetical protein